MPFTDRVLLTWLTGVYNFIGGETWRFFFARPSKTCTHIIQGRIQALLHGTKYNQVSNISHVFILLSCVLPVYYYFCKMSNYNHIPNYFLPQGTHLIAPLAPQAIFLKKTSFHYSWIHLTFVISREHILCTHFSFKRTTELIVPQSTF